MMKFLFSLVFLLHLCYGTELNTDLNKEIKRGLDNLTKLSRRKTINISSSDMMPGPNETLNASSCVSAFVWQLKQFLDNVTVNEHSENILIGLKANLHTLEPHPQRDPNCPMPKRRMGLKPFNSYINFLKRLNNSKRR